MTESLVMAAAAIAAGGCFFCFLRHSLAQRGARMTFNFFFFAFLYVGRWVFKNPGGGAPFPGGEALLSARRTACAGPAAGAVALLGWVCLLYAGWFLAVRAVGSRLSARLFPVLLASCLATVCLLYPLEAAGIALGWWHWDVVPSALDRLLTGVPFHPLREGFFFALYFLAAYFLIECSPFKKKDWKAVFFVLPFIHFWTVRYGGGGMARAIERVSAFGAILLLAAFSALEFKEENSYAGRPLSSGTPVFASILLMLLLTACVDVFVIRAPGLLFSLVPALGLCAFALISGRER